MKYWKKNELDNGIKIIKNTKKKKINNIMKIIKQSKPIEQIKKGDKLKVDGKILEVDAVIVLLDHKVTGMIFISIPPLLAGFNNDIDFERF